MNTQLILDLLQKHSASDETEGVYLDQIIEFVQKNPENWWQRSNLSGHLTGSAWILAPDHKSALLIHHKKLNKLLQPGGHADDADGELLNTARREAREECGNLEVVPLSQTIFDVDIHPIPEKDNEPAHNHYDIRFIFEAPNPAEAIADPEETNGLFWVPIEDLLLPETAPSIRRMAMKTE